MDIQTKPQAIHPPEQAEGTTMVLRTWLKQNGDRVTQDEPLAELETDKVVVEVFAPCSGVLEVIAPQDSPVTSATVLGHVIPQAEITASLSRTKGTNAAQPVQATAFSGNERDMRLSPVVRRLVAEHHLDPKRIQGTGRGGRLTRQDVINALNQASDTQAHVASTTQTPSLSASHASTPDTALPNVGTVTHIAHSPMRLRIAQHMQQSLSTAPHVTAVFEADLSAIMQHRQQHRAQFSQQGVKLTLTAYFVAAAAKAMKTVPQVNSRWHDQYLAVSPDINIGIGTALGEDGLIVPVIHQAQHLSLFGIATRLQALTHAARSGTLTPQDVQHGTFTISNYGVSGALVAAPIVIHQGQAAILGIGAVQKRVIVTEIQGVDSLQIRPMAYVSLTLDHRVLNGDQADAWLTQLVQTIEHWDLDA